MLKKLFLLMTTLFTVQANAYLISVYKSSSIDFNAPTRILVAGAGDDLGMQFQLVARGKALKYRELFPNDQIVLISAKETEIDNKIILQNWGFKITSEIRWYFNGSSFVDDLSKFKNIASLDIFSHSSAQYGIHLDGKAHRLTLNTKGLEKIKGHFTKDAFVFLHGCNGGFNLAPFLSNVWEIPVAGAMTSTNFQKLHNDGNFYLTEEGFYPNNDWAEKNKSSFNKEIDCAPGFCMRLKPDNNPYTGFWGEYGDGGLPFYKFFCVKNSPEDCSRVMAKSLVTFIGKTNLKLTSTLAEYKESLYDFLCPVSATKDLRGECISNLEKSLSGQNKDYNPFNRDQIECDFNSCKVEISCQKVFLTGVYKPGTCTLVNKYDEKATTLTREFKAYIDGFSSLAK